MKSPFDRTTPAGTAQIVRPADTIEPVITLDLESRYLQSDPAKAEVDAQASAAYEAQVLPLRRYQREVVKIANRHVRNRYKPADAVECGAMLWRWAEADALSDIRSETAQFNCASTLSALALAWLQVRHAVDPAQKASRSIAGWFERRGRDVQRYYSGQSPEVRSAGNNHRYWAGLAAAATGVASDNRNLFTWGLDSARQGLAEVTVEGALPREISRSRRALYYHAYALGPLTMLAEFAQRNGEPLAEESGGALHRLVAFTLAGIDDPARFAQVTGAPQEPLGRDGSAFDRSDIAWLEIYNARFPDRNPWRNRMDSLRPLSLTGLGGNLTLLFQPQWKPTTTGAPEAAPA